MRISPSAKTLSTQEVKAMLAQKFPAYSCRLFGLGAEKSIIVRKSPWVGVQVSRSGQDITVEGASPSVAAALFFAMLPFLDDCFISRDIFLEWKALEREIGVFLKQQYDEHAW